MAGSNKDKSTMTVKVALKIMLALSVCMIGLLTFYSMTGTYLYRDYMGLGSVYIADSLPKMLFASCIFICAAVIFSLVFDKKVKKKEHFSYAVLAIASVLLFAAGIIFVKDHPYYMNGDQINTFYGAVYATETGSDLQYLMFSPGGYLSIYPQQKGLVVFYIILYKIFGDDTFIRTQYLHLIYPQIILYSGFFILKTEGTSAFSRILYSVLVPACVPLTLYIPYMYGDLGSIAFSFLSILFLVRFIKTSNLRDAVLLCISCTVALLLRKQIWIFITALLIVLVLESIRSRKARFVITGLCVVALAWGSFFCIEKYFESASGYKGIKGVPSICWVVMGLQDTEGNPGVYNRYNQKTYEDNGYDAELAEKVACTDLRERIEYLKENRIYTRLFFASKVRQEWTAPEFGALFTTGEWKDLSGRDPQNAPGWLVSLYTGARYTQMIAFSNVYQSLIYLLAFLLALGLLFGKNAEISPSTALCLIYTLGGIIFFTFWENKCRYVFPFFVSLVLLAPFCLDEITSLIRRFVNFSGDRTRKG